MTAAYPALRCEVTIDPPHNSFAIVRNGINNRYFRLGVPEAAFVGSLDGATSLEALEAERRFGFSAEQVRRMIDWLGDHDLLVTDEAPVATTPRGPLLRSLMGGLFHHDRIRLTLWQPDEFLERHIGWVHGLFSRPAAGVYLLLLLSPMLTMVLRPELLMRAVGAFQPLLPVWQWVVLYLTMITISFFHELSHAVACKHFGGRVGRIGLMFMYLTPVPFCDVSDAWRFRETMHKVVVSAAGIMFQLLISTVFLNLWLFTANSLLATLCIVNTGIALMNLFPLIKLDGYWILVHLWNQPNLKARSLRAVDARFRALIGRGLDSGGQGNGLFVFGMLHLLVLPIMWWLGLAALFRLASRLSIGLAWAVCGLIAVVLLVKFGRSAARYVGELRA